MSKVRGEEELGFEARSAELSAPLTQAELGAGRLDMVFYNILPQALAAYSLRQEFILTLMNSDRLVVGKNWAFG